MCFWFGHYLSVWQFVCSSKKCPCYKRLCVTAMKFQQRLWIEWKHSINLSTLERPGSVLASEMLPCCTLQYWPQMKQMPHKKNKPSKKRTLGLWLPRSSGRNKFEFWGLRLLRSVEWLVSDSIKFVSCQVYVRNKQTENQGTHQQTRRGWTTWLVACFPNCQGSAGETWSRSREPEGSGPGFQLA